MNVREARSDDGKVHDYLIQDSRNNSVKSYVRRQDIRVQNGCATDSKTADEDSGAKQCHDRQTISSLHPQLPYHWEEEEREDGIRQDVEYDDQVIEIASRNTSLSIERPRTRQSTLEGYRK